MSDTFGFGSLGFGNLAGMTDGIELMKRAWNPFNLPSTMTPTMDIDELDKRIADLKTVEQWLNMNLSMLRGTIQTMEIQRGTLAALQEMGRTFTGAASAAASAAPAGGGDAASQMLAAFTALQKSIGGIGQRAGSDRTAGSGAAAGAAAGAGAGAHDAGAPSSDGRPGTPEAPAGSARAMPGPAGADASDTRADPPTGPNPALWWDLLQRQFQQVAQAALAGGGLAPHATAPDAEPQAPAAARPRARKPRATPASPKATTRARR